MYSMHCTLYTVYCTLHTVQCTLNIKISKISTLRLGNILSYICMHKSFSIGKIKLFTWILELQTSMAMTNKSSKENTSDDYPGL